MASTLFEGQNIMWIISALSTISLVFAAFWLGRRSVTFNASSSSKVGLANSLTTTNDLEGISQETRKGLAAHQANIIQLQEQLRLLGGRKESLQGDELAREIEELLQPTLQLANHITRAYDEIRQHSNALLGMGHHQTDHLTGLNNRQAMDATLKKMFAMFSRYGNRFSLVIFDLDHFKQVNEKHGQSHSDQLLQQVGELLNESVREADFATRYGGDEFVLILPETDLNGACILAQRVRVAVAAKLGVRVSGGVAEAIEGDNLKSLLARADSALYSAKTAGRDQVFNHNGRMVSAVHPDLGCLPVGAK